MSSEKYPKEFLISLRRAGMDYLARREHSRHELITKISRKYPEACTEDVCQVVDQLEEDNLQSDERFTESYVRYRKSRGFGFLHIKQDLARRRISNLLINRYLTPSDPEWLDLLEIQIGKKVRHLPFLIKGGKEHQKLLRFLSSRGFPSDMVRQALENELVPAF